jgi:dUTP pyrophosphatase
VRCANCVGIVDADYRGPVIVALHNDSDSYRYIQPQERIAQLIIQPYAEVEMNVVDALTETERGEGGFGSTGKL